MNKVVTGMNPVICPNCGNTSEDDGITFRYLEWCNVKVCGSIRGLAALEFQSISYSDVHEVTTVSNVPDETKDCQHFTCNRCQWNWYDSNLLLSED